ncbi:MAG: type I restriction-modification system subunit M N-terminal domain-containing protein [Prevotella sp.]
MAKKQIKPKTIKETLWESANKLRGSVEPSEYKHVVLSITFQKRPVATEGREQIADERTFSLSQTNNAELARTLSWRENALFEEREKNVSVKPNEQCRASLNIVMARKRTFRGTRKEPLNSLDYALE